MKNILLPKIFQPFECDDLIRLGKDNDGGYLANKEDVMSSKRLLSFGIGQDTSFETDFITKNKVDVLAFDQSITELNVKNDMITHYPINVTQYNIEDILTKSGDSLFLKCDIDGGEYEILNTLIHNSHKFTGAVLEFHNISRPNIFNDLTNFISKFDLRLIHIHVNNYSYIVSDDTYFADVIELSFSSSRKNTRLSDDISLPNKLDTPNNPDDEDFKIHF